MKTEPAETTASAAALIPRLTRTQRDVLVKIAVGDDRSHHPRVLAALERYGLIEASDERWGGRFPVTVTRYKTPIHVHIAVCAWCSAHHADDSETRS